MLIGCQKSNDDVQQTPFSNFLGYGEYAVGFKTLFTTDFSRKDVPYSDWSGNLYKLAENKKGRSLPLHIWYPSTVKSELLPYKHFVGLLTKRTKKEFAEQNDSLAKNIFTYQINELKGIADFTSAQLDTLLALKTYSSLNTVEVQKKFPLIIFPNGSSPAYESVMCEYLASHGYVVAAMSLKGQFSHVLDNSVKGLEVAVDDLEFALQELFKLPNVNSEKTALLANAIESSFCVGLASRNKKIKALISLDGGFLSQFEQDILNKTSFYEPENISLPILAIYAPHPSISPRHIYGLNFSERYFAHFPEMSEFHFLNFGVFEAYIPNIIGEPRGDVKKGFKAAAALTLSFLNAKLKGRTKSLDSFYSVNVPKEYEKSIDTLFRLNGEPPPPNMAVLKHLFITEGMNAIDSVYQSQKANGSHQPFSLAFFTDFKNWLAWKKDPKYVHRLRLYKMAVESYPNSALNHYRLAFYLNKNEMHVASLEHYQKAKQMMVYDNTLSPSQRASLKSAIAEALQ